MPGRLPYYLAPTSPKRSLVVLAPGTLAWDWRNFIYTEGSLVAGKANTVQNGILGAGAAARPDTADDSVPIEVEPDVSCRTISVHGGTVSQE